MQACVLAVVGPSGVGKDSVMQGLVARLEAARLVRRVITRPKAAGGEDFDAVSAAEFEQKVRAGAFSLHWQAHGLRYGIPHTELEVDTVQGLALVNLSRSVLDEARARFEQFRVLSLTARPDVLARRLGQRGRESEAEIGKRLARADYTRPSGHDVIEISNDGPLEQTVDAILDALYPERVNR